jgi:hypothetical protein
MEIVYFTHSNKNNLDCIELWEYIQGKKGVMFSELELIFNNDDWKAIRKKSKSYCSNLVYCLRKLKNKGALEIIQDREPGGKYNYSLITAIRKPVIKIPAAMQPITNICTVCSNEFKKKTYGSKYKDICQECTQNRFMKSPEIECNYCNTIGTRNTMKAFRGDIYHDECLKARHLETIAYNAEMRKKKRICKECNIVELETKRKKYCDECRATVRKRINQNNLSLKACIVCSKETKSVRGGGIIRQCCGPSCSAVFFAKENSHFTGRRDAKDNNSNALKRKMIGLSCIACDYSNIIHYHHVVERANGGPDVLNNFVPLCPNHHAEVHHRGLDITEYHKKVLQRIEDIKNGLIIIE